MTQGMSGVVKAMESAMRSMNLEKVQNLMDRFEKDFENLDVQSATMEGSMNATTTLNVPQAQVNALIQEAADKAGFVIKFLFLHFIKVFIYIFFKIFLVCFYKKFPFRLELNLEMPSQATTTIGGRVGTSTAENDELIILMIYD